MKLVAISHGTILLIEIVILWLCVPQFMEMFEDFPVKLPAATQFIFNISRWSRYLAPLTIILAVGFLYADIKCYTRLYNEGRKSAALAWAWIVFFAIFLTLPLTVFSVFQPIFYIGS